MLTSLSVYLAGISTRHASSPRRRPRPCRIFDRRKVNTVVIDPERAPFITLAFTLYASGEYTMDEIVDELSVRGLTTRPTVSRPPGPVSTSKMSRLLRDPNYLGQIT